MIRKEITPRAPLGACGEAARANITRMRKASHLTYTALAARLATAGRPIAVLGLRRIEAGKRRVDVDDLAALASAFGVSTEALLSPDLCAVCDGVIPQGFACKGCGSMTP